MCKIHLFFKQYLDSKVYWTIFQLTKLFMSDRYCETMTRPSKFINLITKVVYNIVIDFQNDLILF